MDPDLGMANAHPDEDNGEKPLDPAAERVRRKLVRFMIVNLSLLLIALMAVVLAIVYKSRGEAEVATPALTAPGGEPARGSIAVPAGARIVSQSVSDDRLSLHVRQDDGSQAILIYALPGGALSGRYDILEPAR